MGLIHGVVLILVAANGSIEDQRKSAAKPAANVEHSLMAKAVDGIAEMATKVTPLSPAAAQDDKSSDSPRAVVWVHLSKKYLADYVERNVDHRKPAWENVLGILFTGESRTTGKTRLVLRPNDTRATADVEFVGTVRSQTVGHKGPATLQYVSETNFHARKSLVADDSGIVTRSAAVDAWTRLIPTSITTNLPGLRGRIGDQIARRREAGSRGQAEAIVGRDTASDIRHDFNERLDGAVADIQSRVQQQIAALKLNGERGTVAMRSRSTSEFVEVALCPERTEASELKMAASSPFEGNPDCSVYIHQSVMPALLANAELRDTFAPMFTGVLALNDTSELSTAGPRVSMSGGWLAIDLAHSGQPTQASGRIVASQSLTSR